MLVAGRLDEREEIVGRHRDRDWSQLRLLGEAQGRVHHAPVRRGDEHAFRLARRLTDLAVRRQREEVERRVVRREGQVAVELKPDHLPQLTHDRREVDWLDSHNRAGQADRDAPGREPARVQLRTERRGRGLGLDDERIHSILLDDRPTEPVAEKDDGEPHWSESHRYKVLREIYHEIRQFPRDSNPLSAGRTTRGWRRWGRCPAPASGRWR